MKAELVYLLSIPKDPASCILSPFCLAQSSESYAQLFWSSDDCHWNNLWSKVLRGTVILAPPPQKSALVS